MTLRVLIADDEAPARRKIERFLGERSDVEIVAQASNGTDAVDLAALTKPDLIFLDIHMPELDGIGVAEALANQAKPPSIIFVTAYDEYAVRAFDVRALDYLLKPFDKDRFDRALERVSSKALDADALHEALMQTRCDAPLASRLLIPADGRSFFVALSDVVRFEADGNNVVVHTSGGTYALRATLDSFERRLDPARFARIHRAHLVNTDYFAALEPWFRGDYTVTLRDGTKLPWSRRYAARRPDLLQ